MGPVIELCRSCGFDIPSDAGVCPGCQPASAPSRAARQVAGYALPTRSVHKLPTTAARPEHAPPPMGRARTARSAFSFTTAFALFTFTAAGLAWLADQPRFVLQLPSGTGDLLDDLTRTFAIASVVALALGLVATVVWCVRATARALRVRAARRRYA